MFCSVGPCARSFTPIKGYTTILCFYTSVFVQYTEFTKHYYTEHEIVCTSASENVIASPKGVAISLFCLRLLRRQRLLAMTHWGHCKL